MVHLGQCGVIAAVSIGIYRDCHHETISLLESATDVEFSVGLTGAKLIDVSCIHTLHTRELLAPTTSVDGIRGAEKAPTVVVAEGIKCRGS